MIMIVSRCGDNKPGPLEATVRWIQMGEVCDSGLVRVRGGFHNGTEFVRVTVELTENRREVSREEVNVIMEA